MKNKRIYLSPPHLSGLEQHYIQAAFDSNWVAPLGPNVDSFEAEFCQATKASHALALSSGTAALHLALIILGIEAEDEVIVSTLTFAASVNPIIYQKARPIFIDSEQTSWNMDPNLLAHFLAQRAKTNQLPKAVVLVHLYGQSADIATIQAICHQYEIPLVEDAAEALGATYQEKAPGTFGEFGIYSFNGNKIITTSGGGMLVSEHSDWIAHARKLATQARDPAPHYEHSEIGYNYRMSNIVAGIGRGQLQVLPQRVAARRQNFNYYKTELGDLPGIAFMPEADWGQHNRWLTTLTIDPDLFGADREMVRLALEAENIESRPLWKPMHQQPIFARYEVVGGKVADALFRDGLCLPSGTAMTEADLNRIVNIIKSAGSIV
ncbi:MAG: pyridoxal phosphate-dependent aminotransferase [Chloroflexi bacterium]|nr:MAG: pyridoxal phosphate-dependent aminotransferase [Chloroflexota bacterium]